MFGKKKKIPDSRSVTEVFRRRPEYENVRAAEYQMYPGLQKENLLPVLDKHLEALFAGELDDANGNMLDSIIFAPAREAVPDLMRQHYDHADVLRRLSARRMADREDFRRILEERKRELAQLEAAHEITCRRAARYNGEEC